MFAKNGRIFDKANISRFAQAIVFGLLLFGCFVRNRPMEEAAEAVEDLITETAIEDSNQVILDEDMRFDNLLTEKELSMTEREPAPRVIVF